MVTHGVLRIYLLVSVSILTLRHVSSVKVHHSGLYLNENFNLILSRRLFTLILHYGINITICYIQLDYSLLTKLNL